MEIVQRRFTLYVLQRCPMQRMRKNDLERWSKVGLSLQDLTKHMFETVKIKINFSLYISERDPEVALEAVSKKVSKIIFNAYQLSSTINMFNHRETCQKVET